MTTELQSSFRSAMRRLAATVCIITVAEKERNWGMTATSVSSLSAAPPSLLVCINRSASICEPIMRQRKMCINLLSPEHRELSRTFSGAAQPEERFTSGNWELLSASGPLLRDAQANILCDVEQTMTFATHEIVVGTVREIVLRGDVMPLIYQDGAYCAAAPLAAT